MRAHTVSTIRTVGGLLPPETLEAITTGELDGLKPGTYGLAESETMREAANRSWDRLRGAWLAFRRTVPLGEETGHQIETTRSQWLRVLFDELGYGRLPAVPAGGLAVGDASYPVSHLWQRTPLHLLGVGVDLDHRTPGVAGAARQAPHSMLQELLNRSPDHLWGILTNGLELRLLRDSAALVRQAYVQFDLAGMFDGEVFADFTVMWQLCHASRVEPQPDPSAAPTTCWLERWREDSTTRGTRALKRLSAGVQQALNILGAGFLAATPSLRDQLRDGTLTAREYHRLVLRVVYQLLVLFVAEDRNLLQHDQATPEQRRRYAQHFSTERLRRRAQGRHTAERHTDRWTALRLITRGLGNEEGLPALGLPGLGGIYDSGSLGPLEDAALTNRDLLAAVRALSLTRDETGMARAVDYRNLGAEELGSVYESLLELVPDYDAQTGRYALDVAAGNDRKKSGSYYTPADLVDVLLDETLTPVLDEAAAESDPEAALLAITVCDPACGSGHFLVAAGRRIARRLATHRTGEAEPAEPALRDAMRDVISHCLYGVDLNPLATELAKVALWLEALEPGRPLSFLDAHIKVGNALLGATPELVDNGLPEAAFAALDGDDSTTLSKRRRRNREETIHSEQGELDFGTPSPDFGRAFQELADAPERTLTDVHAKAAAWQAAEEDPALAQARLSADAWCAAFIWYHQPGSTPGLTAGDIRRIVTQGPTGIQPEQLAEVRRLRDRYRFFHWRLEFPDVLPAGFTCIVGNPPWEQMELQEKQFFATSAPEIANAKTASKRKKLVAALRAERPALWEQYRQAARETASENILIRATGRYPLTARGRMNTYALFAEAALTIVAKSGRAGMVLETAIATGDTTAPFFRKLVETKTLASFLDFENEAKIFPDVTNRFRFAILVATGGEHVEAASFAFSTRHVHELAARRFSLNPTEILMVNPNSGTSPIFRSRRDAEITIGIHRRLPVLWRETPTNTENLWGLRFSQGLFNMASDSDRFRDEESLRRDGWTALENSFVREGDVMLPLYEAKMTRLFDHRFATYAGATQAQINKGTLPRLSLEDHRDPSAMPWPQHWVSRADVDRELATRWTKDWLLGWRDIAKDTDDRTFIATVIPRTAVGHKFPLALPSEKPVAGLHANLSALVLDYCARQKLSGASVIYSLVKQLPVVPPSAYSDPAPWQHGGAVTLHDWITPRVLELSYTAWDLQPYAQELGDGGSPFQWHEERRAQLRAELDGAYLHLYGLDRDDAAHVIDSFFVLRKNEERQYGEFRTRRLVLEAYDAMTEGSFVSPLDPAPGQGQRHPDRRS